MHACMKSHLTARRENFATILVKLETFDVAYIIRCGLQSKNIWLQPASLWQVRKL